MKLKPTEHLFNDADLARSVDCVAQLSVQIKEIEAWRDAQIQHIQEQANHRLVALEGEMQRELTAAERYAQAHRDRLFAKKKRASTPLADYGLRTTTPKLVLCGIKADELADQLEAAQRFDCIRRKVSLHRPTIIKALKEGDPFLDRHARIEQREEFYVHPKTDKAEA